MVWQDFMFACGNYPTWPDLLESIKQEAVYNVRRLRHHPSIVIYAGNNEDYQVQEQNGLEYDFEDKNPENWLKTNFPARYIYEKILPSVVQELAPRVFYHPGSPWGDGKVTSDPTVGDLHQWNGKLHTAIESNLLTDQCGMENKRNIKYSTRSGVDSIVNSECRHFHISRQLNHLLKTKPTNTPNRMSLTSTIKPKAMNADLRLILLRMCEQPQTWRCVHSLRFIETIANNVDPHISYTSHPSRSPDVRIPWLASSMGRRQTLRRRPSLATERLLAWHILGNSRLPSPTKASLLRSFTMSETTCNRGTKRTPRLERC